MRRWRCLIAASVLMVLAGSCGGGGTGGTTTTTTVTTNTTAVPTTPTAPSSVAATTPATSTAIGKQYGGEVIIADDQEPPTLNPFIPGGDNVIVSIVAQAHMAGAYDVAAPSLELVPELALEIPSLANGGVVLNDDGSMSVRYRIRDEAVWSDGEPVVGADFALTLDLEQGRCFPELDLAHYFEVEEVGEKVIVVRSQTPTLTYETLFTWVVPSHALEGTDVCADWIDATWPAAGPFVVDEVVRGEYLRLVRNDDYWKVDAENGLQLPYLDAVVVRFIPESETIINAFVAREIDVIQPPPFHETVEDLEALESEGAVVQVVAGPVWEHFNFQFGPNNRNGESLNRYRSFRQAVAYAMDRDALIQSVGVIPIDHATDSFVSSSLGANTEAWAQYRPDADRSAGLVAEACDEAGSDCATAQPRIVYSTTSNGDVRIRVAEALEAQLEPLGFEVELQLEDSQLFFGETLESGTWDMGMWAWVASPGAAGVASMFDLFDPDAPPPDGSNYYRWGTPDSPLAGDEAVQRYRELLAELRTTIDRDRAVELAIEMEQLLADEAVIIPLYNRLVVGAYWADEIAGYEMNPTQAGHTWNIEAWYRVDR